VILDMYRVEVDRNKCVSCGVCYNLDPIHFEADWKNKSAVVKGKGEDISVGSFEDDLIEDVKSSMKSCPTSAIKIMELN
jgi:ferredoxin